MEGCKYRYEPMQLQPPDVLQKWEKDILEKKKDFSNIGAEKAGHSHLQAETRFSSLALQKN